MRAFRLASCVAATALACGIGLSTAAGQSGPPGPRSGADIQVSVQYSLRLPLRSEAVEEQRAVMEQGRKLLYEMAAQECTLLAATIGPSCELTRVNVNVHPARQRPGEDWLTVNGTAQFKVGKP